MGDNMMDAILDQALDDLENIETGATEEEEEEISSDAISNDPTEAEKSQRSDTQGQPQLDGQAEEPLDPKDFFKFLIEGGDDDLGEEVREAKLDEFMKNIQSKLQREVDDSSDSGAKKSSKDKAGRDEDDDDDEVAATLASILEQMTTIEKDDSFAPEGDFAAGNFNPDDIVDGMMEQLLSKDLMYEPMKQVADRYPAWLAANQDSLAETELEKYVRLLVSQRKIHGDTLTVQTKPSPNGFQVS